MEVLIIPIYIKESIKLHVLINANINNSIIYPVYDVKRPISQLRITGYYIIVDRRTHAKYDAAQSI